MSTRSARTGPPEKSGSSARSAKRGKGSAGGKGSNGAVPTKEPLARRMLRAAFGGRGDEMLGLGLFLGGLLAGLSIYLDKAGVVGRLIDDAAGWTVGITKVVLPVSMVGLGLAMFRERHEMGEISKRIPVGAVLGVVGVTGLLHLGRGRPGLEDGADELGSAGGLSGLAGGGAFEAALSTGGAVLVLIGLCLVAAAVITRTTARQAASGAVVGLRPVGRAIAAGIRSLLTPPGGHDEPPVVIGAEPDPTPAPEPEPEPAADEAAPAPVAPKRRRKVKAPPDGSRQLTIELGPAIADSPWRLPAVKLLSRSTTHDVDAKAVEARGLRLQEALAAHGVDTRLVDMTVGPTVTRYALQLGDGVKVARITSLHKDIAYALAAADVRILAPIPGQQAIGIEVPNDDRETVALGDILTSAEAAKARHPLEVGVGRDINGRSMLLNLATMPHLLIAGATGAGKSSCINSLVTSVLMRSTPDQVRMILVDPKRVEMGQYEGVPHLLTAPVTDPRKAANALAWAVKEMERRYDLLSTCGFRDITGYNAAYDRGDLKDPLGVTDEDGEPVHYERLSFILVVVDELADLMMVAARDVEDSICRLAQMARAVGIHLVVATQRPSVNVITGVIKANIPARLAFAESSLADSRVILDQPGAERLVGKGDMLLLGPSSSTPQRIQGAWVGEDEVRNVVGVWARQVAAMADDADGSDGGDDDAITSDVGAPRGPAAIAADDLADSIIADQGGVGGSGGPGDDDELFDQARELVVTSQLGSTSMLQRKLRVGFARAGRLMDLMEEAGVVGPSTGSKAREVLISADELETLRQQGL